MSSEPLVKRLSADLKAVRRRRAGTDLTLIAFICLLEILIFFAVGAARPDMPAMMQQPTFWWRLVSLGLIAAISGVLAVLSFSPTHAPRASVRWVVAVAAVCLAAGISINAGPNDLLSIWQRIDWINGIQCAGKMIALSIPAALGLGILMRRGAPTDRNATALLVGIAAAAWGAFVFVFACPFNDPLYIAVWYSVGCGIVAFLSRIALPRLARW
jgi:hypothetical protein